MSKITIEKNKVIIDGHANDLETCNTLTNLCDELSKSDKFRTVKYESGYGEFDSVEENEERKFPPTTGYVYIYSNDGSEEYAMYQAPGIVVLTTEGVTSDAGSDYTYSGSKTFAGLSTTKNATIPEYVPGNRISIPDNGTLDLYIVEGNVVVPALTAHKTLVGGTAYTVKGGKCMVNGTVYNILKGRTLIGGTGYDITFAPSYDPVFANNTWEQIIAACHNNEVPDTWKVADQKPMTIGGVDYQIDIIGKNHDTYASGGKAPLTFQLHDCYGKQRMNNSNTNIGGWTSCAMRNTHLPAILSLMPTEVQNGIREVNKLTSAGSQSATINTTADKLFLLSEIEIFGSVSYSKSGEGTQYDYYKAGNSRVKKFNGSAISWWERSPHGSTSTPFCCVYINGAAATYGYASNAYGVAFGFCF
jgi:hypothetical protein